MLIYPTLHYQNGGLEFKETGETRIPGLFVAGEVGGGIHGARRIFLWGYEEIPQSSRL